MRKTIKLNFQICILKNITFCVHLTDETIATSVPIPKALDRALGISPFSGF